MNKEKRKAITERLEEIQARNPLGRLTPDDVLEDAQAPDSPLHDQFEWDDTVAAHKHRIEQARALIRLKVIVSTDRREIRVSQFIRDPEADRSEQGYVSVVETRTDDAVALDALKYEFNRAVGFLRRSADLAEALGLEKEFKKLLRQADVIRSNLPAKASQIPKSRSKVAV